MTAGEDISMMDEKEHHETIHEYHSHVSGLLSSKTKDLYEAGKTDTVRGSLISGNEIHMESGRDMTITGSAVISSKDATLLAGRNFKADSAEERSGSTYRESVKKRGLLSGGGLGFTMGSEKRKDRYDSEAIEQVGSTIGSVEGSVYIGAGKNAAILGSEVTAGKDISISGENINLQHTENTYSSLEKDEMARSGLSVSLGGRTVETVHSIAAPLMRAGEVEDARLKGLYALQAGQTAGQLIREEKDAGYVVESLRHNASESANMWEKARDWDRADRIENSRLGKKNSFALDIALGSGKSTSEIESTAHVIKGSMIHGENTVSVRADKDISVSGSRIEGKDVNLEAGRHILITAGENSTEEKQNTHSTSGNMGVSLGVEGIQGIRGGYSSGKGKEEETSRTYEDSWIKADNTLNFVSGKDTAVKGGKLEGDRVKGGVGGSLSLETVQDEKSYHEESHFAGITLSYDFSHGKSGLSGGLSKENIQSHYESASSQSGIYAGDEGFDISVKDNTHLKGAVIDSKGSVDKNTLRTGTLSWEDIENKAGYESGGMGISYYPKDSTTPLNARGLTPQMSPTVKDKADSSTKAAIAKGTIVIMDKKNQGQDISTLHRDTENSLNRLKEIFDKSKVEEKQELLGMMEKYGNQAIHAYAESRGWKDGSAEKVLLHGAFGSLMGGMGTGETLAGALSGSIHEYVMGYLNRAKSPEWVRTHPDAVEWLSAGLGAVIGKVSDASISGMAGIFLEATKWNHIGEGHEDTTPDSVAIGVETRGLGHTSLTIGNKDGSFEEGNYGRYGGNHGSISGRGQTPVGTGTYVIDNNFNPEYSDKIVYILNPVIVSAEGVRNSYNNQFLNANYIRRSLREEESIKLGGGRLINYIYRSVDGMSDYKLVGNNCVSTTMKSIKEGVIEGNLTFQTALTLTALQQAVSPWEVKKILEIDYQLYNGDGLVISRIVGKAYTDEENN